MGRIWSLLFLLVPVLGVAVFVFAVCDIPPLNGHWLPENINDHGLVIDKLFMFILYLTGAIFIGTGIAMFVFLWKYDAAVNKENVKFVHGSHTLEVIWSILPAATLLFIAIYQMNAWADAKTRRPTIQQSGVEVLKPPLAEITGRQFEWRIRYAGRNGKLGDEDDIYQVNDLHLPVNEEIVLSIKSEDVLHSFFLPNLRVKQDVVPGMKQYVWFRPNQTGKFDIVCAELCGWGHYKMRGEFTVESRDKFEEWLDEQYREQETDSFSPNSEDE